MTMRNSVERDWGRLVRWILSLGPESEIVGLLGVFRTVLVCVSGCLLQAQEIAFDLVGSAIP